MGILALAALLGVACREPMTGKAASEESVVCDLENARAEMPQLEYECAARVAKSCFVLGTMIHGRPWCDPATAEPERIRAWALFEKACLLGEEQGCVALGNGAGTRWSVDAPAAYFEEGCRAEVGYACYLRGQQIKQVFWESLAPASTEETIREGLRRAMRDAHPWYERACARGIQEGCFEEAGLLMISSRVERGISLLEQACQDWRIHRNPVAGSALSCLFLADAYEESFGDRSRAHALRHQVCREDQFCNSLYLVAASDRRRWIWALEFSGVVGANGFALWLMRGRCPAAKWHFPLLVSIATLAGLSVAWELGYYFTGSPLQSHAWWAVALLPVLFPLTAWRLVRRPAAPTQPESP